MTKTPFQSAQRGLDLLHAGAKKEFFDPFILECAHQSFPILVTESWRPWLRQQYNFEQGRDLIDGQWVVVDKSKVVTQAHPGFSNHEAVLADHDGKPLLKDGKVQPASLAIDVLPLGDNGKYDASDWNNTPYFLKMAEIAKSVGLVAGAFWKFRDLPHLEVPGLEPYGSAAFKATMAKYGVTLKQR